MFRKIAISIFIICIYLYADHVNAFQLNWVFVFRDNKVHEPGVFSGTQNTDKMKVTALLSGVSDPNDYSVNLFSPDFLDIDFSAFRNYGGGRFEYTYKGPLPPLEDNWEDRTYTFRAELISDPNTAQIKIRTIPTGAVNAPVSIPSWVHFDDTNPYNPTISWELTLAPDEGLYKIRIYELNPDGSFNYAGIGYQTPSIFTPEYTLNDYTFECGKSYAVGIQSRIISTPPDYNFFNRSQYYVRYEISVPDCDQDGFLDVSDNAPNIYNPDQSDIDGDLVGDVADPCPSDPADTCNQSRSGAISVGPDGGSLSTPDSSIEIIIPSGALSEDTSISVTDIGSRFELSTDLGQSLAVFAVEIGPSGIVFNSDITVVFSWIDDDNNGVVDGTSIQEENLIISKNGEAITGECQFESGCDTDLNEFWFSLTSLSEFALIGPLDTDSDGVPDSFSGLVDNCPGTIESQIVDVNGCAISQLCPIEGPIGGESWKNHGQYVSCVSDVAILFFDAGLITGKEKGEIVSEAARSYVGKKSKGTDGPTDDGGV